MTNRQQDSLCNVSTIVLRCLIEWFQPSPLFQMRLSRFLKATTMWLLYVRLSMH